MIGVAVLKLDASIAVPILYVVFSEVILILGYISISVSYFCEHRELVSL